MRTMGNPSVDVDSAVLFACLAIGAVVGFSLTGSAAAGTAIGAACGMALVALRRHRQR